MPQSGAAAMMSRGAGPRIRSRSSERRMAGDPRGPDTLQTNDDSDDARARTSDAEAQRHLEVFREVQRSEARLRNTRAIIAKMGCTEELAAQERQHINSVVDAASALARVGVVEPQVQVRVCADSPPARAVPWPPRPPDQSCCIKFRGFGWSTKRSQHISTSPKQIRFKADRRRQRWPHHAAISICQKKAF